MRLIAVTACPTGVAHTFMAAEALKRQAAVMGHEISVETQGAQGAADVLTPTEIGAADAVLVAADVHVDMARFSGLPMVAVSTADAIRNTASVIDRAVAEVPSDAAPDTPATPDAPAAGSRLVAITSCPTGIAHTFMAAEGLQRAAEAMGHVIKVETQGSVGAKNVLTADDVAAADAVIIAADTKVDLDRFVGKRIYETGTKEALKHGDEVVAKALASAVVHQGDGAPSAAAAPGSDGEAPVGVRAMVKQVYQHLMTGVSYMLPFVVAGGLMIAVSFAVNINANDPDLATTFAGRLFSTGVAALTLFLPVFAGYISFSIADRPGLVPGFIGGYLASQVGAGFLGALLAGFFAGYLTRELANRIRLPQSMAGLKPVLILPLLSTLAVGLVMYYVIGGPISWVQDHLTDWLSGLQGSNAVVLGLILGAMMATDMGGPLNKVAYTFAVGLIGSGVTAPMAAVMAAGMTPPIGLALATKLFPNRWTADEHGSAAPALVLGLSFITEGAIPFAARDPLRVIPALVAGSATAGAISMGADSSTSVPHGGVFDLFVPGAVSGPLLWLGAVIAGTVVTAGVLFFTKRPIVTAAGDAAIDLTGGDAVPAHRRPPAEPSSDLATV